MVNELQDEPKKQGWQFRSGIDGIVKMVMISGYLGLHLRIWNHWHLVNQLIWAYGVGKRDISDRISSSWRAGAGREPLAAPGEGKHVWCHVSQLNDEL